jgi:hypothetical protein
MNGLTKTLGFTTLTALALVVGCSSMNGGSSSSGNDGTSQAPGSTASALVAGQIDSSVSANVKVHVNGQPRTIEVAPDQSFMVRDVPTGDVTLDCDDDGVTGTVVITGVQQGEVIQVTIKKEGDVIVIVIVQRQGSSEPPRDVDDPDGDALVITADHVCYFMKPKTYHRDIVIKGDEVSLIGATHDTCVLDDRTVLKGKLTVAGNDDRVLDVELQGGLVITGQDAHIEETCDQCFNQGCDHGCSDQSQCPNADSGVPVPPGVDAALPPPPPVDASVPPPPVDAGVPLPDAAPPPPPDAAPATDAPTGG